MQEIRQYSRIEFICCIRKNKKKEKKKNKKKELYSYIRLDVQTV